MFNISQIELLRAELRDTHWVAQSRGYIIFLIPRSSEFDGSSQIDLIARGLSQTVRSWGLHAFSDRINPRCKWNLTTVREIFRR